eukprot:6179153-Pleurochrysis_carterae.AAC.4
MVSCASAVTRACVYTQATRERRRRIDSALRVAQPTSGPLAWCAVSDKGLSFTVNEAKSLQVTTLAAQAVAPRPPTVAFADERSVFHTCDLFTALSSSLAQPLASKKPHTHA